MSLDFVIESNATQSTENMGTEKSDWMEFAKALNVFYDFRDDVEWWMVMPNTGRKIFVSGVKGILMIITVVESISGLFHFSSFFVVGVSLLG